MEVILRRFEPNDITKIKYFFEVANSWKQTDAPWEDWSYNENYELNRRLQKTSHNPCFEFEIIYNNEHIGWISSYYMTDDFKWNDFEKTDKIAVGIDIADSKYRGLKIGKEAYKQYINYYKNLGFTELYTQTWSGNIPMINLAKSLGFEEINRYKDLRTVNGKKYDALTFRIYLKKTTF